MGVSPMTELANNLCDTSLGITPILDSKVSSSVFQCFGSVFIEYGSGSSILG